MSYPPEGGLLAPVIRIFVKGVVIGHLNHVASRRLVRTIDSLASPGVILAMLQVVILLHCACFPLSLFMMYAAMRPVVYVYPVCAAAITSYSYTRTRARMRML